MNRWLYLIPVVVLLGLGTLFFAGLRNNSGNEIPSTLIGQPMPALPEEALLDYDSGDISAILAENPVTLVNFFASWCAPCRAEHPSLIELQESGVAIIGVNYKDKPDNASDFMEELGNPYVAVRADTSGRSGIDWGVSGVPETFFVNSEGVVIKRFFGPITSRAMEEDVLPFLKENM